MSVFRYTARNSQGETVQGVLDVPSQDIVIRTLRSQGLLVTSVSEEQSRGVKLKRVTRLGNKVKLDDLIIFSRQLSTMIGAGLPLIETLDILSQQIENKTLCSVVITVRKDIEAGSTLTDALTKHPKVFSELFINMVKAGETSGMLDSILNQLAIYLEKTGALQRKVKGALLYPAVVSILCIVITIGILVFIIPQFEVIYRGMNVALPRMTQILLLTSRTLIGFWYIFVGLIIIGGYGLRRYLLTKKGRLWFDQLKLNLPIFGDIFRKVAVAKFTRTLSTLIRSGVNIITALEIVSKTAGNIVVENAVNKTKTSIQEGASIAAPLAATGVFPPMVTRMINVGERTGALEEMLHKIAEFYEDQVDAAVAALTSLIEPLLIVFMGIIIGVIVISMYLPIFNLMDVVT